ncbi:TorF family putative porin [Thalassotalea fusca]
MTRTKQYCALSLSFLASTLFSTTTFAENSLTANVGVTSNYLWRGLEQTNGKAAISGGIDYAHNSGFYVGTWVSNADWAQGMTYELDVYGGYTGSFNDFEFDVGFIQYAYPDAIEDVDFSELYTSVTYGAFTLGYATLVDAQGNDFGDDSYLSLDANVNIAQEFTLSLHIGTGTDEFYAGESFADYSISVSKNSFSIGASRTDIDGDDVKLFLSYSIDI